MLEVNINFKKYLNILNEKMTAQRMERFLKDKDTPNSNLIKILIFVIFLFAIIRFFLKTRIVEFISETMKFCHLSPPRVNSKHKNGHLEN